jgi:hypothetical protein
MSEHKPCTDLACPLERLKNNIATELAMTGSKIEILNWAIKCTADAYTMAGLRTVFWNKLKEIEGKEKA